MPHKVNEIGYANLKNYLESFGKIPFFSASRARKLMKEFPGDDDNFTVFIPADWMKNGNSSSYSFDPDETDYEPDYDD